MEGLKAVFIDNPENDLVYIKLVQWRENGSKRGLKFCITYETLERLLVNIPEGGEYPTRRICSGSNNVH